MKTPAIGASSELGMLTDLKPGAKLSGTEQQQIQKVAAEFESLLISQMLKSFREASSSGPLSGNSDAPGQSMLEMAEQQLSRVLAAQGGLGLQGLVEQGLSRTESTAQADGTQEPGTSESAPASPPASGG